MLSIFSAARTVCPANSRSAKRSGTKMAFVRRGTISDPRCCRSSFASILATGRGDGGSLNKKENGVSESTASTHPFDCKERTLHVAKSDHPDFWKRAFSLSFGLPAASIPPHDHDIYHDFMAHVLRGEESQFLNLNGPTLHGITCWCGRTRREYGRADRLGLGADGHGARDNLCSLRQPRIHHGPQ